MSRLTPTESIDRTKGCDQREGFFARSTKIAGENRMALLIILSPLIVLSMIGLFITPPVMSHDTTIGMRVWHHFMLGGAWNSIAGPDSQDISQSLEGTVTWWSPGQYVPLGILTALGLPLGAAMVLLATVSALSATAGLVTLARALGAPAACSLWVAIAAVASWHTLYAFGMFIGGEVALAAVWPWIVFVGWKLRRGSTKLILGLTPFYVLGAFAKHSFAVYGIGLLVFLLIERLRDRPLTVKAIWWATWPLFVVGLLFTLSCFLWFPPGAATPAVSGPTDLGVLEVLGFVTVAPWLSASGLGSLMARVFFLLGIDSEDGWRHLAIPLSVLSPFILYGYVRMTLSVSIWWRIAGLVSVLSCAALFLLLIRGGSISLEDRHFRPAGLLLLTALGAQCAVSAGRFKHIARIAIVSIALFGLASAGLRVFNFHQYTFSSYRFGPATSLPTEVIQHLMDLSRNHREQESLYCLTTLEMTLFLPEDRTIVLEPTNLSIDQANPERYTGSAGQLFLVVSEELERDGRAALLRARFSDYPKSAWTNDIISGWHFWHASSPN